MGVKSHRNKAHIRFSTQIIKRLGEELNSSIDQSILELVKNAYDADARSCTVELSNITEVGGTVKIMDDGNGMNLDTIKKGWLVLGESSKSPHKRTKLGRIPAGSKGLGRLAALRMGQEVELLTVDEKKPTVKLELRIDWNLFDKAKLVDDVNLEIKQSGNTSRSTGTTISIKRIREGIGDREVKKIARGLILLADPFDDDPNAFKPQLKSTEFKEMETLVSKRYFDDADYHLIGEVDDNGMASVTIVDYRGQILFKGEHKDITSKKRKGSVYKCPRTTFNLWAFTISQTAFATRRTSLGEVKAWLSEFGGVHLYENGLRVNPYGNPGNDWLDMNLSRAKSPEERPSTNTSIGVVRIKDSKGLLSQKTDRSGFIENDTFHEIKSFCRDALDWMAKKRMEIAEKKRKATRAQVKKDSKATKETIQQAIDQLTGGDKVEIQRAFSQYERTKQREVETLRSEVQLYRTLSTAGITAATFSHESHGNPIKIITVSSNTLERRVKEHVTKKNSELFIKPISNIRRATNSLAVLGNVTLRLLNHEKRRVVRVEVHEVIREVLDTYEPFFVGREITVMQDLCQGKPYLRASEAAFESILTNLLNNSINALEKPAKSRVIKVSTSVVDNVLILNVSDNGPGISGIEIEDIWLPGHTTNPNGTGLGLAIVSDAVVDLQGNVYAKATGELGGAEIIVELPILGT